MTAEKPLRLVQVGAGGMGRAWLRTLADSPDVELVGLADLDRAAATASAAECGHPEIVVAESLTAVVERLDAPVDAVVDVTVPEAHLPVNLEALAAGLPVLCEKPAAPRVAEALLMVAASQQAGRLVMISQSRRYYRELDAFAGRVRALGSLDLLSVRYFMAPHFPGFRERMAQPLLVDMAIHHFDQARYLTGADPVAVTASTHNPPWSWFDGDASANVDVEFDSGAHLAYVGSWVSGGVETSWNADWNVRGERGSAHWDGESVDPERREIAGSLAEFVAAVRGGLRPDTRVGRNVYSLAIVEAAVRSAELGRRVLIAEVLTDALQQAGRRATPEIAERLRAWTDLPAELAGA